MTLWESLGVGPGDALAVAVSAVAIVAVLLVLLRLLGQRSIARMTTFDVAVLLVLGSAGGRVITGYTPTLVAGVLALAILVGLRSIADRLARTRPGARLLRNTPIMLIEGGHVLRHNLKQARLSDDQLWETLRAAGVRNLDEIAVVVFESNGAVSVIRSGAPLDPRLLASVRR